MKLLIISDSPAVKSGQGRVVRELARRFHADGVIVAVAGWFDLAAPSEDFDYPVWPAIKARGDSVKPLIERFQPDVVLAIGDPWDFDWLGQYRREVGGFKLVGYLNIEAEPIPLACEASLDAFDVLVTSSEYGAKVINRPGVRAAQYGVDGEVFKKIQTEKVEIFGRDMSKSFVVLLNAQNTYRKNLRAALAGFAEFAKDKDDVVCYANCKAVPTDDDADGPNLLELAVHLGIEKLVFFNPDNRGPLDTVSDHRLNGLYSFSTVLLLTSFSEGFGLPVLEAMSAGVVPIAPDAYSMPELLGPNGGVQGILIPVAAHQVSLRGTTVAVVADRDVTEALELAYQEWRFEQEIFEERIRQGQAVAAMMTWDRTYADLVEAMAVVTPKVATGGPILGYLRIVSRRLAQKYPDTFGVLKLGGLGDMLQTTAVIRAAARKYGQRAVVFCNKAPEVFAAMPEVAETVKIESNSQQKILESIADAFPRFLDVRYVSRAYGEPPTELFERHRWFYEFWTASCNRLGTLETHSTAIMLATLGLDTSDIRPVYTPRQPYGGLPEGYVAIATGVGAMGGLKRWPMDRWEGLLTDLSEFHAVQVGGREDELVPGAIDARGLSLPETAWILEHARRLIAVEGGMVHLAAAVGTPAIVIFGPTPIDAFLYPGHKSVGVQLCQPCWQAEPNWSEERCAIGRRECANFPMAMSVAGRLRLELARQAEEVPVGH